MSSSFFGYHLGHLARLFISYLPLVGCTLSLSSEFIWLTNGQASAVNLMGGKPRGVISKLLGPVTEPAQREKGGTKPRA